MEQSSKKIQEKNKKRTQYLTLKFKMKSVTQQLLMFFPVPLAAGLGYQLDGLLGVSLKKGEMLPKQ